MINLTLYQVHFRHWNLNMVIGIYLFICLLLQVGVPKNSKTYEIKLQAAGWDDQFRWNFSNSRTINYIWRLKVPSLKIHTQGDFIGKNSLPLGHLFCDFVDYYDRHVILETFSRDWERTEIYLIYETNCKRERLTYCIESESLGSISSNNLMVE